jgi:peptidoglycan/LPS O-acetylase OafA/YrhL
MPYEIRMYAGLAVIWFAARLIPRWRSAAFQIVIVSLALVAGASVLATHFLAVDIPHSVRLVFMFAAGASCFVLRDHIPMSPWIFWPLVIALVVASNKVDALFVVYTLAVSYVVLYLSYIPSGVIRQYNRIGDYSYGTYIYAFPVQQSVAALVPGVSPADMIWIAGATTIFLAFLSWHLVEKRALGLKTHYVGHTERWLGKV